MNDRDKGEALIQKYQAYEEGQTESAQSIEALQEETRRLRGALNMAQSTLWGIEEFGQGKYPATMRTISEALTDKEKL